MKLSQLFAWAILLICTITIIPMLVLVIDAINNEDEDLCLLVLLIILAKGY